MNEKIMKSKYAAMADIAAREAMDTLEAEGTYTLANSEMLCGTAWQVAYTAYVCNDVDLAEGVWLATQAARRHALAICGGCVRREHIKAGKLIPAWLLAQ